MVAVVSYSVTVTDDALMCRYIHGPRTDRIKYLIKLATIGTIGDDEIDELRDVIKDYADTVITTSAVDSRIVTSDPSLLEE